MAVGQRDGAAFHVQIVVRIEERQVGVGQLQAHHAGLRERHQFAGVGLAVAVGVLPDQQAGEVRIEGIDHAVAVAVVAGQLGEAVALARAAEQFADIVDLAVVVAVDGQEAVALGQPAGLDRLAGAQQVEAAGHVFTGDSVDAVAVQVDRDRGDRRVPAHVVLARRKGDGVGLGDVGERLAVAGHVGVDGVVGAGVLDAPLPVAHVVALELDVGLVELNVVAARGQVGKLVVAVGIGLDRSAQLFLGHGIEQRHRHAADPFFAGILHAVVVAVAPDLVADAGLAVNAGVFGGDVLARAQRDGAGAAHVAVDTGDVGIGAVIAKARLGEEPAAAVGHFHLVVVGGEAAEQVLAAVVGDGGGLEHVVGVVQLDGHAIDTFFAGILHAVVVAVFPHAVADARCLDQAGVTGQIDGARCQRELRNHAVGIRIRINAVVVALVLLGEQIAVRRIELDRILARAQVAEQVLAVGIGNVGGDRLARFVEQRDLYAAHAALVALLDAVAVGVEPHAVADGAGLVDAGIHVGNVLAGGNGDRAEVAAGVGVAVERIATANVLLGDGIAVRQFHGHAVGTRFHHELVIAVAVGGGGLDHFTGAVAQFHGHARLAAFAAVLDAVAILVEPHAVTDGGSCHYAGIDAVVDFAGDQREAVRQAAGAGVGIELVVAAGMGGGKAHAFGQRGLVELHAVGARLEVGELVVAVGVGPDRRTDLLAIGVEQGHLDVANAGFAAVLQAVAVLVEPHAVAHAGSFIQAGIDGVIGFAVGHGDLAALAGAADIAVERGIAARVGGGEYIALGRGDGDRVGAGVGREAVVAVDAGGGGLHDLAGAVLQLHGGADDAGFARILHAVGIAVFPHAVADGGFLRHQAGAHGHVVARGQRDLAGGAGIEIGVGTAAARRAGAGGGQCVAGWQGRFIELHAIRARLQAGELVVAVGVGGGHGARHGVAVGVEQSDAYTSGAGFAFADQAVTVLVEPDEFADRRWTVQAGVDVEVVLARGQHHGGLAIGAHVAVERAIGALAGSGEYIAGRRRYRHRIGARIDGEAVLAAVVGGHAGHHVAVGVLQVDDHAVDARFAGVLHAVAVAVFPHAVAHGALLDYQAGVQVLHAVARGQHHLRGDAGIDIGVGVERAVGALALGREQVVGRQRGLVELDAVGARFQVAELVVAVGVGDCRAGRLAGGVEQGHAHACHAAFAAVLHAVAVGVVPDGVAQRGWTVQAGIDIVIGGVSGQVDQAGIAAGIDIAVERAIGALRLRSHGVAGRGLDRHRIGAGCHVEVVVAAGIGGGGGHDIAVGRFQLHFHAGHARFAGILHAIAVGIFPYQVAQVRWRNLEGEVVRGGAGIGRAAANQAARIAHLEADFEGTSRALARLEAQLASLDVGGGNLGVEGNGHAVQLEGAGRRQGGDDHRLEGVVLDGIDKAEIGLGERHRAAIIEVESFVGAGRGVVDRIDDHAQVQRDGIALGALVEHELVRDELAVVVGRPLAGTNIQGIGIDLAEQRSVLAGDSAIGQHYRHRVDLQRIAGDGGVTGTGQDVTDLEATFGIFANVNSGSKIDRAHAFAFFSSFFYRQ